MPPELNELSPDERLVLFALIGYFHVSKAPSLLVEDIVKRRSVDLDLVLSVGKKAKLITEESGVIKLASKASITASPTANPEIPSVKGLCEKFYAAHFRIRCLRPRRSGWDFATMRKLCRTYTWQTVDAALLPFLRSSREISGLDDFARHLSRKKGKQQ